MQSITSTEAIIRAKIIAAKITSEELDAYEGAMQICKKILDRLEDRIPDTLWPFKSNASAIEDYLWNAQDSGSSYDSQIVLCKNNIMEAARNLRLSTVVS